MYWCHKRSTPLPLFAWRHLWMIPNLTDSLVQLIKLVTFMNNFSGVLAYWLIGFGCAFGDGNSFIGTNKYFLYDVPIKTYTFVFFQVSAFISFYYIFISNFWVFGLFNLSAFDSICCKKAEYWPSQIFRRQTIVQSSKWLGFGMASKSWII